MKSLGIGRGNNILENLLFLLFYTKVQSTIITTQINEIHQNPIRQVQENAMESSRKTDNQRSWKGKISIYSATYGGCLYCKKYFDENGQLYYLTASGERLNDSLFTLAANFGNLGDMVSVCNLSNFKCVGAKINDRGGFDTPEYNNRIADLSIATAQAIEAKTDQSLIEISKVP